MDDLAMQLLSIVRVIPLEILGGGQHLLHVIVVQWQQESEGERSEGEQVRHLSVTRMMALYIFLAEDSTCTESIHICKQK